MPLAPLAIAALLTVGAPPEQPVRPWGPPAILPASARAHRTPAAAYDNLFRPAVPGLTGLVVDRAAIARAAAAPGAFLVRGFPIEGRRAVDLEVERFWITGPGTRFVIGNGTGPDTPAAFDPNSVILLRGQVAGQCNSRVYLAISEALSLGIIDLGPGMGSYGFSSRPDAPAAALSVLSADSAASRKGPVGFCTVHGKDHGPGGGGSPDVPIRGLRQVELAVETDYEFFQLLGTEPATLTYLVAMYGAVSDVFMREINVRLDLSYTRIWPQPNEPFNAGLNGFVGYWENNMGAVPRDVAQMFSGRGDLPGGVAYLSALCGGSGYSFCGNALGFFTDPVSPNVFSYDPMVCAHELGHNFGSQHTDVYGIDNCNNASTVPQRGTIMSYCNQSVSGAMSVIDMGFHVGTRNPMLAYLPTAPCTVLDCNQNGRSDTIDIALAFSADANANGIPDECEDCNQNNVLDSIDIGTAFSLDLNTNGIPDECEPDCNHNDVPDDRDILLATSQDLHGDGVPDECDTDLNANLISDYNEIWASMPLDKDRDRTLDSRQDCDNDNIPDLTELEGARDGWAASLAADNTIREYHSITGVLMGQSAPGSVSQAQDLIITPTRRILVTSADTNRVVEFTRTGALVGTLVAAGSGGLANPAQMLLTPAGTLLVASRGTNAVLEYNLTTGAFIGQFVTSGSGGLVGPFGLTYGPTGNLFVSSITSNQVFEYNGLTGVFVRIFVPAAANGGLSSARGLVFNTDGTLLVCSFNTDQVKQYHGATGAYIRNWLITGLPVDGPWCIRKGPDGMIYVSRNTNFVDTHFTRARIFIHDPRLGNFVRAYVQGNDSGLTSPTGFDFMPGDMTDCNRNQLPDSCDISSGRSQDLNQNGVPDECERTCYANCDLSTIVPVLNVADFACFLNAFAAGSPYANCDGSTAVPVLNVADFACFLNRFAAGCP